jgi:hypothetical protein
MYFKVTTGKALSIKAQVIIRRATHQRADNSRKLTICQFLKMDKKVHFGRVRSPKSRLKNNFLLYYYQNRLLNIIRSNY